MDFVTNNCKRLAADMVLDAHVRAARRRMVPATGYLRLPDLRSPEILPVSFLGWDKTELEERDDNRNEPNECDSESTHSP
jgi:hypothetical protein